MADIGRAIVMLAAEVVGYSSLIRADEKSTLERLEAHREEFVYPKIAEHSGRIVRATGDSLLVEFESPTEAVQCAVDLQSGMVDRNIRTLPDQCITFQIGVTIGQVTGNGNDLVTRAVAALPRDTLATLIKPSVAIYGERGDIAVRLAALAGPGGICISGAVQDAIRDRLPLIFKDIGKQNLEIGAAPVHCYAMKPESVAFSPHPAAQNRQSRPKRLRSTAVAVGVVATVGICGVAWLAWLATNSPRPLIPAPVTAGSHAPSIGVTADGANPEPSLRQSPMISSTAADTATQAPPASQTSLPSGTVVDRDTQALPGSQPSLASNAAADRSIQAPSRPAVSEIGAIVVRGKQAQSALQVTPENGTAAMGGIQAPPVLQTTADSGATVVRGKIEASALQITPDSGAAVVRGNQAPSTQIAPNAATDVVRGTRISSAPPPSSPPDQR